MSDLTNESCLSSTTGNIQIPFTYEKTLESLHQFIKKGCLGS